MSLDFQVTAFPYKSSSFATPEGEVLAALCIEMLMNRLLNGALLSHRFCGGKVVP